MSSSRRAGRRGARGFTLLELLVVVAILGVMILVTVSFSQGLGPESALDAAAREVSSRVEEARNAAVVCGRRVFVEYDLGEGRNPVQYYRTICEPQPGREKDADADEMLLTVRDWRSLQEGVTIESVVLGDTEPWTHGVVRVAVQPDGSMPSHLIRLWSPELDPDRNRATGWACVQVAGLLGQARVLNRYVEPEFLTDGTFQ
jgi:prepilin-type N-terminal cleavage/methylation domain-containing protein